MLQAPLTNGTLLLSPARLEEISLCHPSPTSSPSLLHNPAFNKCPVEKTGYMFESPPGFIPSCQPMQLSENLLISLFRGRVSDRKFLCLCQAQASSCGQNEQTPLQKTKQFSSSWKGTFLSEVSFQ